MNQAEQRRYQELVNSPNYLEPKHDNARNFRAEKKRQILQLLSSKKATTQEISVAVEGHISTIRDYLKELENSGLITRFCRKSRAFKWGLTELGQLNFRRSL